MGMRPPSLLVLAAHAKPPCLCSIMWRMMSLMEAMHLWKLCAKVKGDSLGNMMQSFVVVDVDGGGRGGGCRYVKLQIIKEGGGIGR